MGKWCASLIDHSLIVFIIASCVVVLKIIHSLCYVIVCGHASPLCVIFSTSNGQPIKIFVPQLLSSIFHWIMITMFSWRVQGILFYYYLFYNLKIVFIAVSKNISFFFWAFLQYILQISPKPHLFFHFKIHLFIYCQSPACIFKFHSVKTFM